MMVATKLTLGDEVVIFEKLDEQSKFQNFPDILSARFGQKWLSNSFLHQSTIFTIDPENRKNLCQR
jgi:hypothetical protein